MEVERVIHEHYTRVAKNYDEFLYYSPDFVRTLTEKMIQMLQLKPRDHLADVGCGTGMYSLDILKQVPLEHPVVGVDPFQTMLDKIPDSAPIEKVAEDALIWAEKPATYDKILIKETVHHIQDRPRFFRALHQRLAPGGILLLVHVPPDLDYPLFEAALERARGWHAKPDELERQLKQAGFEVQREGVDYSHKLPKSHYHKMVQGQYMSVLSSFSQAEIAQGLNEMAEQQKDRDVLEFTDHFDYIAGTKP